MPIVYFVLYMQKVQTGTVIEFYTNSCLVESNNQRIICTGLKNVVVGDVVDIELLTTHPEARTNTFKIGIKPSDFDKAMSPDVWPYRVGVRMFKQKRTQNTWSSQAGRTGGNIQPGVGQRGVQPGQYGAQRQSQPQREVQQRHSVIETSNQYAVLNTEVARQFGN